MPERRRNIPPKAPEYLQTSFITPEDAPVYAELLRVRYLITDLAVRYSRLAGDQQVQIGLFIRSHNMQELTQEEIRLALFNNKNRVLDVPTIRRGTFNSSPVRMAEDDKPAILATAASVIAVHRHPSGDPPPAPRTCA